jgi:hypothetical protein
LTPNFSYIWKNSTNVTIGTTKDLTSVPAGNYFLTATDNATQCKSYLVVTINESQASPNSICVVTVDTLTRTNRIAWEKVSQSDLDKYNLYRESSQAGLYFLIASIDKDSLSEYTDPVADPQFRSWRYKLAAVNSCGVESELSEIHKTIHLTVNEGLGGVYNLIWDDFVGQQITTYYIWRYTVATGWVKIDSLSSNNFSYTDTNPPSGGPLTVLDYQIEAGPISTCTSTRGAINTSRSNIKSARYAPPTGLNETLTFKNNFIVYPNPTNGLLTIEATKFSNKNASIEVVDIIGKIVVSEQLNANTLTKQIDISKLQNGVYFVRLIIDNEQSVRKIILQH